MPPESVPADAGWDDPAWLDQDPMTAEEREAWLDHLCESDDPPEPEEDEEVFEPLTAAELAEIRAAAASASPLAPLVAAEGRRGPGMPGSARVLPRWKVDQLPDGTFRWTTPSGRQYTTEPTRYPI